MKVTEFSDATKVDHVAPPWEKYLGENDFISYMPSYTGGTMRDAFEECIYPAGDTGDITYYLFDPVKNGAESGKKYPLLVFLHGATNALDGRICVSHSGGEMFATPEYQSQMGGGAYILVPLANEKKNENGELTDSWSETYLPHIKGIIGRIMDEHENISKVIIGGGSSGGYMTWLTVLAYPQLFEACFPVSSHFMPGTDQLEMLDKNYGMKILYACGKHDEFGSYSEEFSASYKYIDRMKNGICYCPEIVRNGDHGAASLYFGIEMGQHCMITQIQANLMYDDGTPYCDEMPRGVTGWIADIIK